MTTDLQPTIGIIIIAASPEVTRGVRREITTDHPHQRRKGAKNITDGQGRVPPWETITTEAVAAGAVDRNTIRNIRSPEIVRV